MDDKLLVPHGLRRFFMPKITNSLHPKLATKALSLVHLPSERQVIEEK
ncbi:MAG: hypothetical protein IPO48_20400 [Saprospiraceae bacterium]|nr:hypothetical protein [Saprospiraceae bacterium]